MIRTQHAPLGLALALAAGLAGADAPSGQTVYTTYCAACHGPEGAGLVGPNLTDRVFLHGGTRAEILKTISQGVGDKGMPAWSQVLSPAEVEAVADFSFGLIGKNLKGPVITPASAKVTPFPQGSVAVPLLLRSFMPSLGLDPAVLAHHRHGQPVAKYDPGKGSDVNGMEIPIEGLPSVIAVNFGETLSYAFDTVECRLLYTWSGPFMDMTRYWGAGAGGSRKSKDYVPVVLGPVWWRAAGSAAIRLPGAAADPRFTGYRKVGQVPELEWRQGAVTFSVLIKPGKQPGEAVCRYTTSGADQGLELDLAADGPAQVAVDAGTRQGRRQVLDAAQAKRFTVTITPGGEPVVAAPKPEKPEKEPKPDKDGGKPGKKEAGE